MQIKKNKLKKIYYSTIIFISLFFLTTTLSAMQPYQTPGSFEPVPQGSAQCGPTSFYMIFNYFNDQQLFVKDNCTTIIDFSDKHTKITKDSQISQYFLGGSSYGISLKNLKTKIDNIYEVGSCNPYYISELENSYTGYNSNGEKERRERLEYIKNNYLDNNIPVILHLKRFWFLWGHYIVLTGYDDINGVIYYADPNGALLNTVTIDDFIKKNWYLHKGDPIYMQARWDGKWIGFYTNK